MNKLLCNHEVRYIKTKKEETFEQRILSKTVVTEDKISYVNDLRKRGPISFVVADPDKVKKSAELHFYQWDLKIV